MMIKKTNKIKIIVLSFVALLLISAIATVVITTKKRDTDIPYIQGIIEEAWNVESSKSEKPEFYKKLEEKSSFNVKKIEDDGDDHYTVTVEASSPYIIDKLKEYENSIDRKISDDEIDKKLLELVNSSEIKSTDIKLTVVKADGKRFVEFNDEFIDAMFGYAYSYSMSRIDALAGE